jgi:hypothetical protein
MKEGLTNYAMHVCQAFDTLEMILNESEIR